MMMNKMFISGLILFWDGETSIFSQSNKADCLLFFLRKRFDFPRFLATIENQPSNTWVQNNFEKKNTTANLAA